MKKRISLKEWESIGRYNYARKIFRPFCSYFLLKKDNGNFVRLQYVGFPLYAIFFIPLHLLQIICLFWSGGLKDFEIMERHIGQEVLCYNTSAWKRANEIWEGKK